MREIIFLMRLPLFALVCLFGYLLFICVIVCLSLRHFVTYSLIYDFQYKKPNNQSGILFAKPVSILSAAIYEFSIFLI